MTDQDEMKLQRRTGKTTQSFDDASVNSNSTSSSNADGTQNPLSGMSGDSYDEPLSCVESFLQWDVRTTNKLAVCATKDSFYGQFRPVMKLLEISCHGVPWIAIPIYILAFADRSPDSMDNNLSFQQQFLVNLLIALLLDLVVIAITKTMFRRQRPAVNVKDMFVTISVDNYSFPSGHCTRASMVALILVMQLDLGILLNITVIIWSLVVAFSRILLGRHHVFDVFCGYMIGIFQFYFISGLWLSEKLALELLSYFI